MKLRSYESTRTPQICHTPAKILLFPFCTSFEPESWNIRRVTCSIALSYTSAHSHHRHCYLALYFQAPPKPKHPKLSKNVTTRIIHRDVWCCTPAAQLFSLRMWASNEWYLFMGMHNRHFPFRLENCFRPRSVEYSRSCLCPQLLWSTIRLAEMYCLFFVASSVILYRDTWCELSRKLRNHVSTCVRRDDCVFYLGDFSSVVCFFYRFTI